ncbi:glycosyltransferase family 2 protein [Candidatus Methylopumilus planktonicus]|uniref:glycosyltransferase family 2 protein n=1 Tax=Candidatus Methylopumilus planktonicus TaxID=1581557 RepID=UPI001CB88D9D|nr:glycosyltransferase family 2 protein [Candidatus Methylopumilus planktonicus]
MKPLPYKILVAIPTYNCENQIIRVLEQFNFKTQKLVDTVIVIDNKSSDRTLEKAIYFGSKKFKFCNFLVLRNKKNFGLGGSHKVAFNYSIKKTFDYIAIFHGDDQASFKDFLSTIKALKYESHDCILGSRFLDGSKLRGYSILRTFGNILYNNIFSFVTKYPINDLGSGLNLYKVKALKSEYFKKFPDDLTFNYVMILAQNFLKQKIKFIPISWREDDQISNVNLFRQALKVLVILFNFITNKYIFLQSDMRSCKVRKYNSEVFYEKLL